VPYARFESVLRRLSDGTVRKHLRVCFRWKGPGDSSPRRHREATGLLDTYKNRQLWKDNLHEIVKELILTNFGTTAPFDPRRWFANSHTASTKNLAQAGARLTTVGDFAREYFQSLTGLADSTKEQYRLIYESYIYPSKLAGEPLATLNAGPVQKFLSDLENRRTARGEPLKASSINKVMARVRPMITAAWEQELIKSLRNPTLAVKNLALPDKDYYPFDEFELMNLFAVCEGQQRAMYITAALTGLRPSELIALEAHHLNFERGLILVRQQMTNKGEPTSTLKTRKSRREIAMFPPVKLALREMIARNRLRSRYVFCGPQGRALLAGHLGDQPWRTSVQASTIERSTICGTPSPV